MAKVVALWVLLGSVCVHSPAFARAAARTTLPVNVQRALAAISPEELKGDLSFLASDALEGRFTPSPGLEVAAEFIASKFRAAGLEPGGDHDYFQMAEMVERREPRMTNDVTVFAGGRKLVIPAAAITPEARADSLHLLQIPLLLFTACDATELKGMDLTGKAVMAPEPDWANLTDDQRTAAYRRLTAFEKASAGAALKVMVGHTRIGMGTSRLLFSDQAATDGPPTLLLANEEIANLLAKPMQGARISADVPAATDTKFFVKNVIGVLRGSDPVLSKTAVLLTAHYDHIGTVETATGLAMQSADGSSDRIYDGANDDGSGTLSVIEIARALARLRPRPKRTIVFMTFFGEERGELGSQFYAEHPVFPMVQTVADLNLEQMGRTDATNGRQLNNATVTGFDYSDVTRFLISAGRRVGIKVYRDPEGSDAYFSRSDNDALAEQGVPAHTLGVAFDYPDYHGLGDEWPKIDYENMAKVDRMVLLALLNIGNSPKRPEWNADNPKAAPFRAARTAARGTH